MHGESNPSIHWDSFYWDMLQIDHQSIFLYIRLVSYLVSFTLHNASWTESRQFLSFWVKSKKNRSPSFFHLFSHSWYTANQTDALANIWFYQNINIITKPTPSFLFHQFIKTTPFQTRLPHRFFCRNFSVFPLSYHRIKIFRYGNFRSAQMSAC